MRLSISVAAGVAAFSASSLVAQTTTSPAYVTHIMVADQAALHADLTDPNLVNPWGNVTSATSPFWVADTGSGLSTVYTASATAESISGTKPTIPAAAGTGGTIGSPTGIVTGNSSFPVNGTNASFIFDTLDGTISAWSSGTTAVVAVNNSSSNAVYTGLARGGSATAQLLYAANYWSGQIEIYDATYKPVTMTGAFTDASLPSGYVPFNIWPLTVNGTTYLYVAYTKQDPTKKNYSATVGAGVGAIDAFDMSGNLVRRIAQGGVLNAPWGLAIAPPNFGPYSNMLLVGNFGDGKINVFDPVAGTSMGPLMDHTGNPIAFSGLWALLAGNGGSGGDPSAVYVTAGIGGQQHGELAVIQYSPAITTAGIVSAASGLPGASPGAVLSIYGPNLAPISRMWTTADFVNGALPTSLTGVSVTIDSKPAYVTFISPKQINVIVPADSNTGSVPVVVTNNGLASASASIQLSAMAPAFFIYKGTSIAAQHADGTPLAASGTVTGSTPGNPGETIVLYATGCGSTSPAYPAGQMLTQSYPLPALPTVTIGGTAATVTYAGIIAPGLYQINVTIPSSTPAGDQAVVATIGGTSTQSGATINVQ